MNPMSKYIYVFLGIYKIFYLNICPVLEVFTKTLLRSTSQIDMPLVSLIVVYTRFFLHDLFSGNQIREQEDKIYSQVPRWYYTTEIIRCPYSRCTFIVR